MAAADMFLKVQGVTGESSDKSHKGEIDVVSWSWGMEAPASLVTANLKGASTISELRITKRVDNASPTLMNYLRTRKKSPTAQLTIRKSGSEPLEYFVIQLEDVFVTSVGINGAQKDMGAELVENISLSFSRVRVSYTPQGAAGGAGGGENWFEANAHSPS